MTLQQHFGKGHKSSTLSQVYSCLKVKTTVFGNGLTQDCGKVIILSGKCNGCKKKFNALIPLKAEDKIA